jgi:hypothetical protein
MSFKKTNILTRSSPVLSLSLLLVFPGQTRPERQQRRKTFYGIRTRRVRSPQRWHSRLSTEQPPCAAGGETQPWDALQHLGHDRSSCPDPWELLVSRL